MKRKERRTRKSDIFEAPYKTAGNAVRERKQFTISDMRTNYANGFSDGILKGRQELRAELANELSDAKVKYLSAMADALKAQAQFMNGAAQFVDCFGGIR